MAGPFSTYFKNALLDHVLGGPDYARVATVYAALFESGTEVSGGSYVRDPITNDATNFPAASSGAKSNGTAITFATPSAGWGTPDQVRIYDAVSGGNLLGTAILPAPLNTIVESNIVKIEAGALTFTLTDPA